MIKRRKLNKMPKLNLIPILDAIFIFIFFLLMSAQFLDIYEIGSDAPITTTLTQPKQKKEPLNLTLEISKNNVLVKTGLEGKLYKKISTKNLASLNDVLIELKNKHPEETSAILKPKKSYEYHKIIKVIDHTREVMKPNVYVTAVDDKKRKYPSKVLFDKIIFETQN
ncbi:MAG: biopolymer transporter ExbD [Bacteriovoracaceae bacterium]|nr:biopolymer transporter ExbD [Bacteriovoracaceae bacterium]